MFFNDFNSELHIRLHIAEILKDKVEQTNYEELCNKVLQFVLNGIELPKTKKDPMEEISNVLNKSFPLTANFSKMFEEIAGKEAPLRTKEDELKDLFETWQNTSFPYRGCTCFICGYSTEFNCLIVGTFTDYENSNTLGKNDVTNGINYRSYFYMSIEKFLKIKSK